MWKKKDSLAKQPARKRRGKDTKPQEIDLNSLPYYPLYHPVETTDPVDRIDKYPSDFELDGRTERPFHGWESLGFLPYIYARKWKIPKIEQI